MLKIKINKPLNRDLNALLNITEYSFDLSNAEFVEFAKRLAVLQVAGKPCSERWRFTQNFKLGEEDFYNNEILNASVTGCPYSPAELQGHWRIMQIARGRLQDVWERFTETENVRPISQIGCGISPPLSNEQIKLF